MVFIYFDPPQTL